MLRRRHGIPLTWRRHARPGLPVTLLTLYRFDLGTFLKATKSTAAEERSQVNAVNGRMGEGRMDAGIVEAAPTEEIGRRAVGPWVLLVCSGLVVGYARRCSLAVGARRRLGDRDGVPGLLGSASTIVYLLAARRPGVLEGVSLAAQARRRPPNDRLRSSRRRSTRGARCCTSGPHPDAPHLED